MGFLQDFHLLMPQSAAARIKPSHHPSADRRPGEQGAAHWHAAAGARRQAARRLPDWSRCMTLPWPASSVVAGIRFGCSSEMSVLSQRPVPAACRGKDFRARRGFVFGDGVYELVPVYSKKPFRLDEHLRRLQGSLDGIRLANPYAMAEWRERILQLIALQDFCRPVALHPGDARRRRRVTMPFHGGAATVFMFHKPLVTATPDAKAAGVCAVTAVDNRWLRCNIKAISLLANICCAAAGGGRRLRRTVMLARRIPDRRCREQHLRGAERRAAGAAASSLMLTGINLRRGAGARRSTSDSSTRCGRFRGRGARSDELWMTSSTKEIMAS